MEPELGVDDEIVGGRVLRDTLSRLSSLPRRMVGQDVEKERALLSESGSFEETCRCLE